MPQRSPNDEHWWQELDGQVLDCLADGGAMSPTDVARHLEISEAAAVSLLCLLAQEGRVTIQLVECRPGAAQRRVA